jgi:sortase A
MQNQTTGSAAPSFLPVEASQQRSLGSLVGLSMRRPGGRHAVSALIAVLIVSGVSMMAFPAFTDLFQRFQQRHVQLNTTDPNLKTRYLEHKIKVGQGLTRLVINNDRMKVNVVVVEGTTPAALNAGAGHYVSTPFPCEQGNVGIAGHRTTYGRPFNKIDEMHVGDTVDLITPIGRCTYQVVKAFGGHSNPWVVLPNAYYVVGQDGALGRGHWLTLTSCHPLGSDSHRIVLRLRLVKMTGKA